MSFNKLRLLLKYFSLDLVHEHFAIRRAIRRHVAARSVFSQDGEDQFVADYFHRKQQGSYVEIGANNPVLLNSTYLLYREGWRGIVVDPIRRFHKLFEFYRPQDLFINAAAGSSLVPMEFYEMIPDVFSTFDANQAKLLQESGALVWRKYSVPVRTLASILGEAGSEEIDFMSIDAEGFDFDVLSSNDWNRFRPGLISCEIDKWEGNEGYFQSIGYKLVKTIGYNAFYARD